ncbi:MAG: hypothetical protein PF542_04015 [Nanoarchaeota archaeon]|jgi:hypothetical protein|nr:hypothetical protein [Nanoarchaeota archaeon]
MEEIKSCATCDAACCKYVAMEIDCPEDLGDFENIKWYVAHENIRVFVEDDNSWNIEFITPCKYLIEDNKCKLHEEFVDEPEVKRPAICKEFGVDACPHHNDYTEKYEFTSIEDVERYLSDVFEAGNHIVKEDEVEEDDSADEE